MKQKMKLQFRFIFVLGIILTLGCKTVYANDSISKLEEEKESLRKNLEDSQEEIGQLEEKKEGLKAYLDDLNTKLTEISDHLTELGSAISHKQTQIEKTNKKIEQIKLREKEQYENMKKRIQFMYEQGSRSYLEVILSADSFADMLNRVSYVKEIASYDRDMLEKYQSIKKETKNQEKQLVKEEKELEDLLNEAEQEQNRLAEVMRKTAVEISVYGEEINLVEAKAAEYEEQIRAKEQNIEEEKKEQERIIQARAKSAELVANAPINASDTDLTLLSVIIECEAAGESYEGKIGVGAVVLNRVRSSAFPNTILGVIYQSGQFSPVASGRFAAVLARGANNACTSAAVDTLAGANTIGNALYFKRNDNMTQGQIIGNHVFY